MRLLSSLPDCNIPFMLKPSPNTWSDKPLPLAMSATDAASGPTYADLMVGPTYAQIFGPVFWGFCCTLVLCGVSALQGYLYFTRYNDKLGVRSLAIFMILLDFLSMALICQSIYYYMLPHFGSFAPLSAVTNELVVECLIAAIITFASQMYFVYQLYMVKSVGSTASVMNALVVVFSVAAFAGSLGCVVIMFQYPQSIFMNRNHYFAVLAGLAKGFGAAADIIATIAMCMFLKSADTGITRTSSILKSLMHLVINRGILVTATQILQLIFFFATANHLYWLAVHINTTKLYVNTFFGMLNARPSLQDRHTKDLGMSFSNEATGTSQRFATNSKAGGHNKGAELDASEYPLGTIHVTTSSTVAYL
ncbi:hypothetical protein DFH08DRAFT_860644 [Mycena albidolilacea]|uniref:DUF6534 domain-containing protein n=1 Tax=Mycena albidolilacea TaxID=1033008 RepID=A0AAD7EUC3_9AGAR|nr:hypothetical protein DFH08DRAFT_860644 [Mycena albidolilacea]